MATNSRLLFTSRRETNKRDRNSEKVVLCSSFCTKALQQIHALFSAGLHQVLCDNFYRSLYLLVRVKVFVIRKAVKSLSAIHPFDLRKASFNWVELRAVGNVLDFDYVQFSVLLLDFLSFVHG